MSDFLTTILVKIVPLFFAIVFHEMSHAAVAYLFGDDTAKQAGRFKLYTHFDIYGSFLIPLFLFLVNSPFLIGYAKPVIIDPRKFKDPLRDMAIVAIAGPLSNLLMAFGTVFFVKEFYMYCPQIVVQMLLGFIVINLGLMFFNLIPIPPLDGSRIIAAVLPTNMVAKFYALESFGFIIIIILEFVSNHVSKIIGTNVGLFHLFIEVPAKGMLKFLLG